MYGYDEYDLKCMRENKWEEQADEAAWMLKKYFPEYGFCRGCLVCNKKKCLECKKVDEDTGECEETARCENVIIEDCEDDDDGWDKIIYWSKGGI